MSLGSTDAGCPPSIPDTTKNRNIFQVKEYSHTDAGPFQIIIESTENNLEKIHPMKLGRIIKTNWESIQNNIKNISYSGQNRIGIEFDSTRSANHFINSEWLKSSSYKTFIPNHLVTRQGVIRNIDTVVDEKYILDNIRCLPFKIINVRRMNRKITINDQVE